jgi:Tautomerase enzyme
MSALILKTIHTEEDDMPDILVEVRGNWLAGQQAGFLDVLHEAFVGALKYPPGDKLLRLIEHAPASYAIPHGMGEKFTRIEVVLFEGRSLDAKRALYQAAVQALRPFGVPPADVKIVLIEIPTANVGFRGGKAACDVDLGYALEV